MRKYGFTVITALTALVISVSFIPGCSNTRKASSVKQEQAPAVDEATQQAFREKLETFGIPVYPGAAFVDVKRKSKDSPLLYAEYDTLETRENTYEQVKSFYAAGLRRALGSKGWKVDRSKENVILYRKGFEIFYVELTRVVILPDARKIRIAFYHGT
jgi:hypothetical protein